jgi:hypothetical protein
MAGRWRDRNLNGRAGSLDTALGKAGDGKEDGVSHI